MAKKKKRLYTLMEREEVVRLAYKSKLGTISEQETIRIQELYKISPGEYGDLQRKGASEAHATMNPWREKENFT